jgi:hypothetical protein
MAVKRRAPKSNNKTLKQNALRVKMAYQWNKKAKATP